MMFDKCVLLISNGVCVLLFYLVMMFCVFWLICFFFSFDGCVYLNHVFLQGSQEDQLSADGTFLLKINNQSIN